jgi:hypothetical protein
VKATPFAGLGIILRDARGCMIAIARGNRDSGSDLAPAPSRSGAGLGWPVLVVPVPILLGMVEARGGDDPGCCHGVEGIT